MCEFLRSDRKGISRQANLPNCLNFYPKAASCAACRCLFLDWRASLILERALNAWILKQQITIPLILIKVLQLPYFCGKHTQDLREFVHCSAVIRLKTFKADS